MLFQVKVRIGLVDGTCIDDVAFHVRAVDDTELRAKITRDYVLENVSDDWGRPITYVSIIQAEAILES